MPSLKDSLEQLERLSQQIHQQSCCNTRPSGPYTTAYLAPSATPDYIRDAKEPEQRLFRFIGENENDIKKVEKREGPVTPLKALQSGTAKGGRNELEVVIRTAARLVDDYRPMPRARSHLNELAERHERQMQKIAELEKLISELNDPSTAPSPSITPSEPAPQAPVRPTLPPDEAMAAEEESLKALDAYLKANRPKSNTQFTSPQKESEKEDMPLYRSLSRSQRRSPFKPRSPKTSADADPDARVSPVRSSRPSIFASAQTPGKEYPHIANSLVTGGPTPHRSIKINRFGSLENISTPQKQSQRPRGSIFGFRASTQTSGVAVAARRTLAAMSPEKGLAESAEEEEGDAPMGDETIRVPSSGKDHAGQGEGDAQDEMEQEVPGSPAPRPIVDLVQEQAQAQTAGIDEAAAEEEEQATPTASPVKLASPIKRPEVIHGVKVNNDQVAAAISRVESTFPELVGKGDPNAQSPARTEQAINHLYRLSTSEPDSASIPDPSSTVAAPATRDIIYQAFLCLLVLQSEGLSVPMSEIKETFGTAMGSRGLGEETDGGKIAWKLVGKKIMRIDRSGSGGPFGSLRFAS